MREQPAALHGSPAGQTWDPIPGQLGAGCICQEGTGRSPEAPASTPAVQVGPRPTREEAARFLDSRAVMNGRTQLVVMANRGNQDLVDNLLCSLRATAVNKYLLFASDAESFQFFRDRGYSGAFFDPSVLPTRISPNAVEIQQGPEQAQAWAALLRARVNVVRYILGFGHDVLFTDADVVFSQPG
eukprot:scaffold63090_cov37-Prasinocladus_malaysianus.AAC.1